MNQIFTGYKIYLLEIIWKLINKTKRATFPYHTFFWDALYTEHSLKYTLNNIESYINKQGWIFYKTLRNFPHINSKHFPEFMLDSNIS